MHDFKHQLMKRKSIEFFQECLLLHESKRFYTEKVIASVFMLP